MEKWQALRLVWAFLFELPVSFHGLSCCAALLYIPRSQVIQMIEQINVDEFIELEQKIFALTGISGLASGRSIISCLILPTLWLGELLGQNKLACLLTWMCRRRMLRYDELGDIINRADGLLKLPLRLFD